MTRLVKVPVSLVSLVDKDRQFFKSQQGLDDGTRQTPLSHSFCQHVVIGRASLIVENAEEDARVCDNLAVRDLGVKAYLGVPLITSKGHVLGSLCAIDTKPRTWSDNDLTTMKEIAAIAMSEIELREEITRRHAAEDGQELLIAELHHRVKNTLSTVQALIQLSLKASLSLSQFRDSIGARISSLANTHTLLTRKHWRAVSFRDILNSELEPFCAHDRITLDGPDFDMEAEIATSVGMVIHELTTNASKYGSLSSPDGKLHLQWSYHENADNGKARKVELIWTETGGPKIQQEGTRGFGSSLIERLIVRQFSGSINFDFKPGGLVFQAAFAVPVEK